LVIIATDAFTPAIGCQRGCDADNTPAGFLSDHLLYRELGDEDETFEIGRGESFEILGRVARERLGDEDASVVHEHVDGLKVTNRGSYDIFSGSEPTDVTVDQRQLVRRHE
jgi:hypothetical protein